jgi:PAS domain S-box-containing protein
MKSHDLTLRVAASFGLLATVLVVVGWQGVSHSRQQNIALQGLIAVQWKEVQMEHRAFLLSELNSRLTLSVFFLDDPGQLQQVMTEREANTGEITALMATLDPLLDPEESRYFAAVKATRAPYLESYQAAISTLVTGNNRETARKLLMDDVQPKLKAYHDAWSAFDQYEAAGIDKIIQQSRAEYLTGVREFLFTMVVAGALASAIAIFTVIRLAREIAVRRHAELSLQEGYAALDRRVQERTADLERLRTEQKAILNSIGMGVHCIDLDGRITYENPIGAKMLGYEPLDLIGKPAHGTIHHKRIDQTAYPVDECPIYATLRDGHRHRITDEVFWRKDGTSFPVEYTSTPMRDEQDRITGAVVVFEDLTERKRIEARLVQSQKMKTVGRLAGGVAHEFNSILTAIIGQSELLLSDLPPDDAMATSAREIRRAADRAAVLTRQLLAYGRKQMLQPETVNLNRILSEMLGTLQHLMGRDIDVRIIPAIGLKSVSIDPGQMEQVIVNIAMNAADAMPGGGIFTLETTNMPLDEDYVRPFPGLKPGNYVMLAMSDTGTGMTPEVKTRAFEPFFSTKGVGQGTGLGLSTCYGIIKQSGGHLSVYSEPGRGTTFRIYLPQVEAPITARLPQTKPLDLPRGTESILLAEDDPSLLETAATLLRRQGYTVFTASNGLEALSVKNQRDIGHIDLLLTDVVMPHMSGKELSDRMSAIYPHTKILFTSAFTETAIVNQGIFKKGVKVLQKPFTPSSLAAKVREVLDQ